MDKSRGEDPGVEEVSFKGGQGKMTSEKSDGGEKANHASLWGTHIPSAMLQRLEQPNLSTEQRGGQ